MLHWYLPPEVLDNTVQVTIAAFERTYERIKKVMGWSMPHEGFGSVVGSDPRSADHESCFVYGDYTTALQVLSGYLRSHSDMLLTGNAQTAELFGRGYGLPPPSGVTLNITYAADQVGFVLPTNMENEVGALNVGAQPAIDLSNDELIGQPWTDVNFGWLHAFMVGIDLRGASLESSQWSNNSDLSDFYLQCADLQNVNFRWANLSGVDLEGAYVQGADFRGANIKGAVFGRKYSEIL